MLTVIRNRLLGLKEAFHVYTNLYKQSAIVYTIWATMPAISHQLGNKLNQTNTHPRSLWLSQLRLEVKCPIYALNVHFDQRRSA